MKVEKQKDLRLISKLIDNDKTSDMDRLLAFHIFCTSTPGETDAAQPDDDFSRCATTLTQRTKQKMEQHREIIAKQTMATNDRTSDILVRRLWLEDQRLQLNSARHSLEQHARSAKLAMDQHALQASRAASAQRELAPLALLLLRTQLEPQSSCANIPAICVGLSRFH